MNDSTSEPRSPSGNTTKILVAMAVALGLFALIRTFDVPSLFRQALAWIQGLGPLGPVVFVALYIVACVLMVPGTILTLGAGLVWGVIGGTVAVSVASVLGASTAFLVGRYLARDWVQAKVDANPKFKAIDRAVAGEGWKIVLLIRLSPLFPFNLLNYAFGLTPVKFLHHLFGSWIGMLPGTVMFVYFGSLAGDLASLGAGGGGKTPAQWALYGVGLAATVAVSIYVTRIAKAALDKELR